MGGNLYDEFGRLSAEEQSPKAIEDCGADDQQLPVTDFDALVAAVLS